MLDLANILVAQSHFGRFTSISSSVSDPADFSDQVKFFPKIDMYDVTNEITTDGSNRSPFLMILKWLETKFNFTAKYLTSLKWSIE